MRSEKIFNGILKFFAAFVVVIVVTTFLSLVIKAMPSIKEFGLKFLVDTSWDPVSQKFGAATFIVGTLYTSFLALIICIPFAIALAILLGEYYRTGPVAKGFKMLIDLLASIPSVIYGFWGIMVLVPIVKNFSGSNPTGLGVFTASIILSIMIIPYAASLSIEVLKLVPQDIKEAAYSLGATRFEVVSKVVLSYGKSGIFAGIMLSLGRALGETMAVTMLIGNVSKIPTSIFDFADTMASVIASQFNESTSLLHAASMIEIALILFVITAVLNVLAKFVITKIGVQHGQN